MNLKKSINRFVINYIILIISICTVIYINSTGNSPQGYENLYMLPLIFGICYIGLLSKPVMYSKSIFLWTFTIFAVLRYIVLPFLMTYQGYYGGIAIYPPHSNSIQKGIVLMIYEMIVSTLLIRLLYRKTLNIPIKNTGKDIIVNKFYVRNKFIYISVILLAAGLVVINRKALQGISFFNVFNRGTGGEGKIIVQLSRQLLMVAKLILYFIIIDKLYTKYVDYNKKRYLWFTYIISFVNIGIYIGVNRKRILMNGIASIMTINFLYPKEKKKTSIIIIMLAAVIFLQLTIFRFYSNNDKNILSNSAGTLQVYLSGPYNMAMAVETKEDYDKEITAFNILYDVARPFYGIGEIFKRYDSRLSTEYFNQRLSVGGPARSDQIMPITGQGLLHFGYILSPIYLMLVILLGFQADKKFKEATSFEKKYILALICMMFGQVMGVNLTIITNFITFEGILFYIIYWLNRKVTFHRMR